MSIVCEEVFDESSHPSIDEIRDYASKIGIDPDSEPQLLPLAAEGLMKALPPGWKPCYDDKSKSYYYYNNLTSKTQWEHPLDDLYRGMVKKVRAESQSLSLGEPTEDATYARDDLPSFEEPPLQLPTPTSELRKPPIKLLPSIKSLIRHKSENELLDNEKKKISLNIFNSLDEESNFNKHPRSMEKTDLKLTGNGTMFLKANTKKINTNETQPKKSILREVSNLEMEKNIEKETNDEEDRKSVRFNLDTNSSTDNLLSENDEETNVKTRFIVSPVKETELLNLKLIKPNPDDFLKPKLNKESDSDDESYQKSPPINDMNKKKDDKQIETVKQNIWVEKNEELLKFKDDLQESHKEELKRILVNEKTIYEDRIKNELDSLRTEMENRNAGTIKEEIETLERELEKKRELLEKEYKEKEKLIKETYENKKADLEKCYENKLLETEKELLERMNKIHDDLKFTHNSDTEQLKQNHSIILEELKKTYKAEEDKLRQEHKYQMTQLRNNDVEKTNKIDEKLYEKIKCEKRLLDEKYRCLKEKYLRLKTDVKLTIEKKNRRKEQSCTTTTGSETERSKLSSPLNSPMKKPPKYKSDDNSVRSKPENKLTRQLIIQDLSTSDNKSDENKNDCESSDNNSNPGRSRKKLFSRLKSSSTSRISNQNIKIRKQQQRSCSPVENLRRQLQKLEDLEDEFPQNAQINDTTYHLRYPFSAADLQKFNIGPGGNCCSELEFFRHRVHLERDSIKRAKESLRSQKVMFQQRQKELKLQHGSMARHTLQQLCQEEKELTDMEVNLHRTRSLLGEKVIRLRHLEASLQRAATVATNPDQVRHQQQEAAPADVTLSDLSSHSASSGISSTEFATAPDRHHLFIQEEQIRESSEIIQSLENLNSEIREIWDVLRKQQQTTTLSTVIPPLLYPDLGWPLLAGTVSGAAAVPAPPSIPTLADRLHNYRQQVALANAQSTMVTHAANQGATTTLVERTRNLRHWLRQAGIDNNVEGSSPQTTL